MAYPNDLERTKNWGTEVLTDTDLEGQFDLFADWVNAAMDSSTGHKHDGTTNEGPKINMSTSASGTLPITNGGTGQNTLADFMNIFMPIGTIYTNKTNSTNPATLFGFGTWVAIEGECIVGFKSGDSDFGSVGSVAAGEKTHTMTIDELVPHTHTQKLSDSSSASREQPLGRGTTNSGTDTTESTGGGDPFNIIQPSHVAYVWERTA